MDLTEALTALQDKNRAEVFLRHYTRLKSLFAEKALDTPFGLQGISISTSEEAIDVDSWFTESMVKLAEQVTDACDNLIFRPMSICYNPHGVHFIDDLFGAEVFRHPFSNQWQVNLLQNPIGTLEHPAYDENPSWRLVREAVELYLRHAPAHVMYELPTLSSALNIAVNLFGQEILLAMLADPAAARHDLRIINDVIVELHTWFLERIPFEQLQPIAMAGRFQPFGHGQICGCTTQLVSNEIYADFIAPLDAEVLSLYPGGGLIHLCGSHLQHIPNWRRMSELKAIQLNDRAALDLSVYLEELRSDQLIYVDYFGDMTPDDILRISGGNRIILVGEFDSSARAAIMGDRQITSRN